MREKKRRSFIFGVVFKQVFTYINEQALHVFGELVEVRGGDHLVLGLLQAVARQLNDLVVDEARRAVRLQVLTLQLLVAVDELLQSLLHLLHSLQRKKNAYSIELCSTQHRKVTCKRSIRFVT